jgi:hypothetical protein
VWSSSGKFIIINTIQLQSFSTYVLIHVFLTDVSSVTTLYLLTVWYDSGSVIKNQLLGLIKFKKERVCPLQALKFNYYFSSIDCAYQLEVHKTPSQLNRALFSHRYYILGL